MVNVHVTELPDDAFSSFDKLVEVLGNLDPYTALKTLSIVFGHDHEMIASTDASILAQKRDDFKDQVKATLPRVRDELRALQDELVGQNEDVAPIIEVRNGLAQMNTFLKSVDRGEPVWLGEVRTINTGAMKLSDGDGNPLQEEVDSPADITMAALSNSLDGWRQRIDEKGAEVTAEEKDLYTSAGNFALNAYLYITTQKAIIGQRMDQALNRSGGRSIGGDDNDDGNGGDIPPTFKFPGT